MRGKGLFFISSHRFFGITPAYAGKRVTSHFSNRSATDHPRVCGEKGRDRQKRRSRTGSPPRMRGKVQHSVGAGGGGGITPAYAGKSIDGGRACGVRQDHPRVCGEKDKWRELMHCPEGSPPRMRGKGVATDVLSVHDGITPAYAGKRLKRSRSTVPPVAIVPLFPSVCNKPVVSDGSPAGRDAPLFLPAENAVPASPAYNLRSL